MGDHYEILIEKSKAGDKNAFGELVVIYSDYIFSIVFRIINNEQEAEDIVQDTFIKVWSKLYKYDGLKSKFSTWLYSIAVRLAIDVLRRKKKECVQSEELNIDFIDSSDGYKKLANKEIGVQIAKACESLSVQQKMIFVLRDLEDLDVSEVVRITGLSEKKIKDNLYVARKKEWSYQPGICAEILMCVSGILTNKL